MKILLAEKSRNLVSALVLVISTIKDKAIIEIETILHVDRVDRLYIELKREKPNVLIINEGFVNYKTRDAVPGIQSMYPDTTILILSDDHTSEKKYLEIGINNFILKGDSAEDFYDSMCGFLEKEQVKISNISNQKLKVQTVG